MTKRNFSDLVGIWANIFKSIPTEQLEDLKRVEDLWSDPGAITRAEVKTGSPQASSGGGAERMVREYSDPAPQMGLMEEYNKFGHIMRDFGKSLDGVHATQKTHATQIETLAGILTAAAKAHAAAPATQGDAADSCLGKAQAKLRKARAELRKADMADDEDKEEREEKKSNLDAARVALKAAKRFLAKAEDDQDEWPDDKEEAAEKARAEFAKLTKALKKAEDDERDREDAEKAREAAAATAKAEAEKAVAAAAAKAAEATTEAVTQKAEDEEDKKEETEKAQAAEPVAAKAAEVAPVDPALRDQIQVMSTTLKGLMETVMGASKNSPIPPTFAKATPVLALAEKVEAAIDDGTLETPAEIMKAQTLVSHVRAVQAGKMDGAVVDDEIAKSPDNVRQLFMPAQAA